MTVDPVCGMRLDPATAAERRDTRTDSYFFCSAQCAAGFDADPDHYRTPAAGGTHEGGEIR
jgi:Cu+-exporting ATPase